MILQRLEKDVRLVVDHEAACLGYKRDHEITPYLSGNTQRWRILESCDCEDFDSSYSGEVRPLILSLFDQPGVGFPKELKPS